MEQFGIYDSITVQGVFTPQVQQEIQKPLENGIKLAKKEFGKFPKSKSGDQEGYFFFQTKPEDYHLTISIVEPSVNDKQYGRKLGDFHISMLEEAAKKNLASTYAGNIFLFQMWVHGYDGQGNQINKKYGNPHQVENGDQKFGIAGLDKDFPFGISKIEFIHRYGTGNPGSKGPLAIAVDNQLIPNLNKLDDVCANPYQGKYDEFNGHMTAAIIKKQLKGVITPQSPRFNTAEYATLKNVYNHLYTEWRKSNTNIFSQGTVKVDHFRLSGRQIVNNKAVDKIIVDPIHSKVITNSKNIIEPKITSNSGYTQKNSRSEQDDLDRAIALSLSEQREQQEIQDYLLALSLQDKY